MADPLSTLLGKKKTDEQAKPKQPNASSTSPPFMAPLAGDLMDVSTALGRVRSASMTLANTVPASSTASAPSSVGGGYPPGTSPPNSSSPSVGGTVGATGARSGVARGEGGGAGGGGGGAGSSSGGGGGGSGGGSGGGVGNSGDVVTGLAAATAQLQSSLSFDDILVAEKVHVAVKNCHIIMNNPFCEVRGRLLATNYRLKFQTPKGTLREEFKWMQDARYFDVPMGCIEEAKMETHQTVTGATEFKMKLQTKDFRNLTFLFNSSDDSNNVQQAVAAFSYPGNPTLLFAFRHAEEMWMSKACPQAADGWQIYDPSAEFARMGVETELIPSPASPWRISTLNAEYDLCATYPKQLCLPRRMADHELRAVASFRKKGRLPAMSWCGGPELQFASVWRCSQTTEGLKGLIGRGCPEDEKLLQCIRDGPGRRREPRDLLLIDLRPKITAWANKASGGGFEGYTDCRLVFGGIDNIHAVRDAWRAMGTAVNNVLEGEVGTWMKDVANSSWYDYIGAILSCAMKIVTEILEHKSSVMIHCSDGWDRTAQTSSLAMICLDPHYRTQIGFLKLIQKEWCSFGHKFRTRLALGDAPTSEYSPVFIQWLECVRQIVHQFPMDFEFTDTILLRLSSEVFTNRYGTFLCDSEKERNERIQPFALSLWSALLNPTELISWRNPRYCANNGVLMPSVSQASYIIWKDYWFRYHQWGQREKLAAISMASIPTSVVSNIPSVAGEPLSMPEVTSTSSANPDPAPTNAPAAPVAAAAAAQAEVPLHAMSSDNVAGAPTLFTPQEVAAVATPGSSAEQRRRPAPTQVFKDDDDDEDIFAKPKRKDVSSMLSSQAQADKPKPREEPTDDADEPEDLL